MNSPVRKSGVGVAFRLMLYDHCKLWQHDLIKMVSGKPRAIQRLTRMDLLRRTLTLGIPSILAWPAMARSADSDPIAAYERASGGHIGVYAKNLSTGKEFTWRANERFIMCSTFKASLAALVLSHVDRGKDSLNALVPYSQNDVRDVYAPVAKANLEKGVLSVEALCKAAVELSDGACANLLLSRVGGPAALTAFWRSIGDDVSRLDHDEPILDRSPSGGPMDSTTPSAMAGSLQRIVLGNVLADQSRARLTNWLMGSQTGFDRLRAGLPKAWVVGDKTGHSGRDVAADLAVAWPTPNVPIVITAFTRGGTPTDQQFDTVFKGIGRLVAARLV